MKLRPTNTLQTIIVALLLDEGSPHMVTLPISTVVSVPRAWAVKRKPQYVVSGVNRSSSCAYLDSVAQLTELWRQDEHEAAVGVTQYTFSAKSRSHTNNEWRGLRYHVLGWLQKSRGFFTYNNMTINITVHLLYLSFQVKFKSATMQCTIWK